MSHLEEHALRELEKAGFTLDDSTDPYDNRIAQCVYDLVRLLSAQSHSGFSANLTIDLFEKIAKLEPLTPLTGEDEEWIDISLVTHKEGPEYQNKRDSRVFKRKDGTAYFIEGKVFREPDGVTFLNGESQVEVTFPFTPERQIIDVDENGEKL